MKKLFLYDPSSIVSETLSAIQKSHYNCVELSDNPELFWESVSDIDDEGILVLYSQGDKNGPLPVAGSTGESIDLFKFAELIDEKSIRLYLLSQQAGQKPCGSTLNAKVSDFVAPLGTAVIEIGDNESIEVHSKNGDEFPGWIGNLSPGRSNQALSLP